MTRRRIIILVNIAAVLLVALLMFLIWPRLRPGQPEQAPAPTATPLILIDQDVAQGRLVPAHFAQLSFSAGGIVDQVLVEAGERVAAGQPLARLNDARQESALAQAQAERVVAETNLAAAEAGLDAALVEVEGAELGVLTAQARLRLVQAGPSPQEIAAAEQRLAAAQAASAQAAAQRDASLQIDGAQIRAAEAVVAAAESDVAQLQQSYDQIIKSCFQGPDGEICPLYGPVEENTRAQLAAARLRLEADQAALRALQAGATAGQRLAAAGAVSIAQANEALAGAELNLLQAGTRAEAIAPAEVAVAQAQARVTRAQAVVQRAQAAVAQAEVKVALAQGVVDQAQLALERQILRASFAGTVSQVMIKLGQQAAPGVPVLTLADLDTWLVETTDLSERDITRVEPGKTVEVTLEAIGGERLAGQVVDIGRVFQSEGGDVIYQVTVELAPRPDLPLRWGMSAEVDYAPGS